MGNWARLIQQNHDRIQAELEAKKALKGSAQASQPSSVDEGTLSRCSSTDSLSSATSSATHEDLHTRQEVLGEIAAPYYEN